MIKEGIPANSLNIRALVNKNPEVLVTFSESMGSAKDAAPS